MSASLHVAAFSATAIAVRMGKNPAFDLHSQPLEGETLDLESASTEETADEEEPGTTTAPASTSTPTPASPAAPKSMSAIAHSPPAASTTRASVAPALFGAVGARFATDLATTFTRAFPQAASADPSWTSAQFGNAGRAEITLILDADGHLAASDVTGSPAPALRRSIERALVLLASRAFTARGAITVLRVSAHVSRDDVHDGLHGDVFALSGGSFSGEVGTAFFALPPSSGTGPSGPGRRVDVEVRLMP